MKSTSSSRKKPGGRHLSKTSFEEKSKDVKSKPVAAWSQIAERHRVYSQFEGVAQPTRTPLSGTMMPNLLRLGSPMVVRKTATAFRKDTVSLRVGKNGGACLC
jgi:hypothetical protein